MPSRGFDAGDGLRSGTFPFPGGGPCLERDLHSRFDYEDAKWRLEHSSAVRCRLRGTAIEARKAADAGIGERADP